MNKIYVTIGIFLLAGAFATGRYTATTHEETKSVQKIAKIEDKKTDKDTEVKKNTHTVITDTILPDGTKTKKTEIIDNDQIVNKDVINSHVDLKEEKTMDHVKDSIQSSHILSGGVETTIFGAVGKSPFINYEQRMFGPFWTNLGITINTNSVKDSSFRVGIGLSW